VLSIVAEAGFLGLCAVTLGIVVSLPATMLFVRVVGFAATGWNVPLRFPVSAAIRVAASVLFFAVGSGLLPGWKAARLEITRALAYE
jgi:ABC-type antimicrobial peptide transport system permease subunit